jgi:hypothetical protein
MKAPREKLLYTLAIYTGTGIQKPDYLVTIDNDPESETYSQVIHRLEMPGIGDELHHMGWNACSSCFNDASMSRRYLIVPGVRSSNLHIVDTMDPRAPRLHKVIEGAEIKAKTDLSAPHTVHCLGSEGNHLLNGVGADNGRLSLATRPGEIYFVSLAVVGGQSYFAVVAPDTGRKTLAACCALLENWAPGQRPLLR